jgi:hypothetical protein
MPYVFKAYINPVRRFADTIEDLQPRAVLQVPISHLPSGRLTSRLYFCWSTQTPTMSSNDRSNALTESSVTIPSDSEQYSGNDEISISPPSSSSPSPVVLYSPPSLWSLLRGAAINLVLPFINGLMLGFGELFAHEAAFRLGWGGTKVIAFLILHLPLFFPFVVVYSSFFGTKGVPHRLDATHHLPEFVLAMHDADQPSIRSFQCHEGRIQSDQGLRFEKTLWRGEGENSWMA